MAMRRGLWDLKPLVTKSFLTESLQTVANWTSKSYQAQKLKVEDSSNYPIWLAILPTPK
jgi:hypothetical protein